MNKTKRILWSMAAVLLTCAVTLTSAFAVGSSWKSFRGNAENNGITTAAPARTAEEAELKWSAALKDSTDWATNVSSAVISDGVLYVAAGSKLLAYDTNGNKTGELVLDAAVEYGVRLLVQGSMVYVPLPSGRVEAVDTASMTKAWTSDALENYKAPGTTGEGMAHQSIGTLSYYDGNIYLETACADWSTSYAGNILCLNATTGSRVWMYENTAAGYYWSGAVVKNGALVVAGDDGKLLSLNAATGVKIEELAVSSAKVRTNIVLSGDSVYFATYDGSFYAVPVNADGSFGVAKSVSFGAGSTSTPVIYGGKAYVGGNTSDFKGVLAVIDLATMTVEQKFSMPKSVQSSPLVATGHNGSVFAYFTMNSTPGALYAAELGAVDSQPITLFTPEKAMQNYCTASVIADSDGTLYYMNDSGTLFAIKANLPPVSSETSSEETSSQQTPSVGNTSSETTETVSSAESAVSSSLSSASASQDTPATGSAGSAAAAAMLFAGALGCAVLALRKGKKQGE